MSDTDFFNFIFHHWGEYLIYTAIFVFICYMSVRKMAYSIIDPIHYFFAFGTGTAYSIVMILWVHDYIDNLLFAMIFSNLLLMIISWRASYSTPKFTITGTTKNIFYTCELNRNVIFSFLIVMYVILTAFYIHSVSFAAFVQSRFEANKGLGAVVRVLDVIRLMLAGYFSVMAYKNKGFKRFNYAFLAILISIIASFVSGAKFSLLEHLLVSITAIYIYSGWRPKVNFRFIMISGLLGSVLIGYVLYMLTYTSESLGYTSSNYIDAPVVVELFFMRIFANGDAYYFSLPNGVIDTLHVENPVYQLFGYIIGNGGMQSLFGYNYSDNDVGRLIWKNWYPWDTIARGPTSHFDLAGYSYFGFIGGLLMTCAIGWVLGRVCAAKRRNVGCGMIFFSSFMATFYCRSLQLLLSPPVGIAYIFDMLIFTLFLMVFSQILRFSSPSKK